MTDGDPMREAHDRLREAASAGDRRLYAAALRKLRALEAAECEEMARRDAATRRLDPEAVRRLDEEIERLCRTLKQDGP